MNTDKMLSTNLLEDFRVQVKNNFDTLFNTPKSLPSVFLNGTNAYVSVANNADINFGTGTFSIIGEYIFDSGNTNRYKLYKYVSNVGYELVHSTANKIVVFLGDGTNVWGITSTNAVLDGKFHVIGFVKGIDSASSKLYIDGIEDTTAVKGGTFPTGTLTSTALLYVGSHKTETRLNRLFNYGLTASQFQKYSYEDLVYEDVGGSNTDLTLGNGSFATDTTAWWGAIRGTLTWNSGTTDVTFTSNDASSSNIISKGSLLTQNKRYRITLRAKSSTITATMVNGDGLIFTTNPALTTSYQTYVLEGITTSTSLNIRIGYAMPVGSTIDIDDIVVQQTGCVLNLTPDTINPLKWNCKNGLYYADLINGEAINLPINHIANILYKSITGNSTVVVPKGYAIEMIYIKNTTANAITGGIKLGTTSGGTDVLNALAIGANYNDVIEDTAQASKKFFSDTANTTLYLQAVSSWNNANLNFALILRRVV